MKNYHFMLLAAFVFLLSCSHKHSKNAIRVGQVCFSDGVAIQGIPNSLCFAVRVEEGYRIAKVERSLFGYRAEVTINPDPNTIGPSYILDTLEIRNRRSKDSIIVEVYHDYEHSDENHSHEFVPECKIDINGNYILGTENHRPKHKIEDPREN